MINVPILHGKLHSGCDNCTDTPPLWIQPWSIWKNWIAVKIKQNGTKCNPSPYFVGIKCINLMVKFLAQGHKCWPFYYSKTKVGFRIQMALMPMRLVLAGEDTTPFAKYTYEPNHGLLVPETSSNLNDIDICGGLITSSCFLCYELFELVFVDRYYVDIT